ncbi:hypothetical protein [Rhizobium sp. C4]|uniref:hypothetical protein n=1 Tax=Rhizobium sp. C4 TaxID=1349800 RepID=UPI001E64FD80|nr:hypothetical protein [Rhizobium sp. C4]MCD2171984.1 hypothetical protein [Rhizobium sp. C4]
MPFHALTLALVMPPLAGLLLLVSFGAWPIGAPLVFSILAPAYVIGAAPAFVAGRLDVRLASRGWRAGSRLASLAALAFVFGAMLLVPFYVSGRIHGAEPLLMPFALGLSAGLALGFNMVLTRLFFPQGKLPSERNEMP